jgi:hypothetical protein
VITVPLHAGRNLFERKKQESNDPETLHIHKTKISPDQLKKVEELSQSIQQGNTNSMLSYYYFVLVVAFILTITLFYLLHKFYWEQYFHSLDNPWNLFRELCTAHELTRPEQQILRQIAEEKHWEDPLLIFIEPLHLKSALNLKRFEKSYSLIESLLEKLFNFDTKNDALMETQLVEHSSTLSTTIIYQKEIYKDESSGVRNNSRDRLNKD